MSLSVDGNSLVFEGVVTISNFSDPTTGVCTLTLTPSGGVGSLPALVDGQPGLPPVFDSTSVTTLSPGAPATASLALVTPGGPGVASHYTANFGIPQGIKGDTGSNSTLAGCTDLSGSAVTGDIPIVSSTGPTQFKYIPFPWGKVVNTVSATGTGTQTGHANVTMATLSIPAQTFSWIPLAFASGKFIGTVNTVGALYVAIGDPTTGDIVGSVQAIPGTPTQKLTLIPSFGNVLNGTFGVVPAGTTTTIYLIGGQVALTPDSWAITGVDTQFTVVMLPVGAP